MNAVCSRPHAGLASLELWRVLVGAAPDIRELGVSSFAVSVVSFHKSRSLNCPGMLRWRCIRQPAVFHVAVRLEGLTDGVAFLVCVGNRELLLKLTKNFSDRESVVSRFTFSMVDRLQQTQAAHLRLMAEHHNLQRLEQENLVPLAHMLQAQYIHMFKQMTHEIVRLVRGVENKQFVNLENLLRTYRKIG